MKIKVVEKGCENCIYDKKKGCCEEPCCLCKYFDRFDYWKPKKGYYYKEKKLKIIVK